MSVRFDFLENAFFLDRYLAFRTAPGGGELLEGCPRGNILGFVTFFGVIHIRTFKTDVLVSQLVSPLYSKVVSSILKYW